MLILVNILKLKGRKLQVKIEIVKVETFSVFFLTKNKQIGKGKKYFF
jgi:hypothetical protein